MNSNAREKINREYAELINIWINHITPIHISEVTEYYDDSPNVMIKFINAEFDEEIQFIKITVMISNHNEETDVYVLRRSIKKYIRNYCFPIFNINQYLSYLGITMIDEEYNIIKQEYGDNVTTQYGS